MNDHGTASIGSWVEFVASVVRQLPRPEEMDATTCEGWSKNQESLKKTLVDALLPPAKEVVSATPKIVKALPDIDWLLTCAKLGMDAEAEAIRKLVLPPADPAIWWAPMVQSVNSNRIVAGMRKLGVNFRLYKDDLDAAVPNHDRDPKNGSYVVGFCRTVEADEKNKNLSANQLRLQNHQSITLPERLWLGAGFFVTTGQHLDVKNITLCAGSRDSDGDVPDVYWDPDGREVYVLWYSPGDHDDGLRSRSVQFPLPA